MNNTTKLQRFLEDNGYWADMVPDSGAKDGYCLCLEIRAKNNQKHYIAIYLNEKNVFILRVDNFICSVECATNEIVLSVIKMAILCGGWE